MILVLGATGRTGREVVNQLLQAGEHVKVIVRQAGTFPDWHAESGITVISADITEMSSGEMRKHLSGCRGVICCLGHSPSLKGVYGKPRKLITYAVRLVCEAVETNAPANPVRLVLMSSAGTLNRLESRSVSFREKLMLAIIRLLLPPQKDHEKAAEFLQTSVKEGNPRLEWVIVRPDSLMDTDEVTPYELFSSPVRSALLNPGLTSRINVANFMTGLLTGDDLWDQWKGRRPVIYNRSE